MLKDYPDVLTPPEVMEILGIGTFIPVHAGRFDSCVSYGEEDVESVEKRFGYICYRYVLGQQKIRRDKEYIVSPDFEHYSTAIK